MTAIITSQTLGLIDSSLNTLGGAGQIGQAGFGKTGESSWVNAATGNLVVQNRDEILIGMGLNAQALRTYNSFGQYDGDNNDNWMFGGYRKLEVVGNLGEAGSQVVRTARDGSQQTFDFNEASGQYEYNSGSGATDIINVEADGSFKWTDGNTQITEVYDAQGRLNQAVDIDGNITQFNFDANTNLLSSIIKGDESILFNYSGQLLESISTVTRDPENTANQITQQTISYSYDDADRLSQVSIDLTPEDPADTDNVYTTSYTYKGDTNLIESISETNGTQLSFTYYDDGKVESITNAEGYSQLFVYSSGSTNIIDQAGRTTSIFFDNNNNITRVLSPAVKGVRYETEYEYWAGSERVKYVTDAEGNQTFFDYDSQGNLILERDALGNTKEYKYNTENRLVAETIYLVADPDGDGEQTASEGRTSYMVYDNEGHLTFTISAEGRVSQFVYSDDGLLEQTRVYKADKYDTSALSPDTLPLESDLMTWVATLDQTQQILTENKYDFRGQLESTKVFRSVDTEGIGIVSSQTESRYVYNASGELLKSVSVERAAEVDASGIEISSEKTIESSYAYDGLGRLITTTRPDNKITSTTYDDANRSVLVESINGVTVERVFNTLGQLLSSQTTASDNVTNLGKTLYFYDDKGRQTAVQDASGARRYTQYDDLNRVIRSFSETGQVTEFAYDKNSQLIEQIQRATKVDTSGWITDESNNSFNFVTTSSPFSLIEGQQVAGSINGTISDSDVIPFPDGQAKNFDGAVGNYVGLGNDANVQLNSGTVEVWFKTDNAGSGYRGLVIKQFAYGIFLYNNRLVTHDWKTGFRADQAGFVNDGHWHKATFTFQNGVYNGSALYLDDRLVMTYTYNINHQDKDLVVGSGYPDGQDMNFIGELGGVIVDSKVLSQQEVAERFNQQVSGNFFVESNNQTQINTAEVSQFEVEATANDRKTSNTYDASGRLVATEDGEGFVTAYEYDGASRLTRTVSYASSDATSNTSVETIQQEYTFAEKSNGIAGESISGTSSDNYLEGTAGNDSISGNNGDDYLSGGEGNDSLNGGSQNDTL
ncbi:MAG: hypothetical protein HWE27_01460, partial [Gammaproteobacteria bacterium]|nr:hypothetical protein [Gammaproteobacteria bacterium]